MAARPYRSLSPVPFRSGIDAGHRRLFQLARAGSGHASDTRGHLLRRPTSSISQLANIVADYFGHAERPLCRWPKIQRIIGFGTPTNCGSTRIRICSLRRVSWRSTAPATEPCLHRYVLMWGTPKPTEQCAISRISSVQGPLGKGTENKGDDTCTH